MLDRFNKAIRKSYNIHRKKKLRRSLYLSKVASIQPDTLLKDTLAQLFSWDFRDTFKNTVKSLMSGVVVTKRLQHT